MFDLPVQWEHLRSWLTMAPWEIELLGTSSFDRDRPHLIPEVVPLLLDFSAAESLTKEQRAVARTLAGEGMLKGRFTTAQILEIAPRFLAIQRTNTYQESAKMGAPLSAGFSGLLASPMRTSVAGTLARMLWLHGEHQPQGMSRLLGVMLLASPTVPVEVLARVTQHYPADEVRLTETKLEEFERRKARVLRRAKTSYPEFADLPAELLIQLVASQPIPTAWFKDAWLLPANVTHRTDGREIGGGFWDEFLPMSASPGRDGHNAVH